MSELEFKGTEGNWKVEYDEFDGFCVVNSESDFGTEFIAKNIQQGYDEGENDAYLIAAAPDLLKACVYYMENYRPEFDSQLMFSKFQQAVHKALNIKEQ